VNARRRRPGSSGALDGFEEHGFAETSIEQVSDLVDVSTTTLFRYFRSKDEAVSHNGFTPIRSASCEERHCPQVPRGRRRRAHRRIRDG